MWDVVLPNGFTSAAETSATGLNDLPDVIEKSRVFAFFLPVEICGVAAFVGWVWLRRSVDSHSTHVSRVSVGFSYDCTKRVSLGSEAHLRRSKIEICIYYDHHKPVRDHDIIEQQQKLFQSFSQADSSTTRKYGGSGLGLIISKRILQMMGGDIWLESDQSKGSTFRFEFPLGKRQDMSSPAEVPQVESEEDVDQVMTKLRGAKILVVDDNEFNQEIVYEFLSSNGMTVETAADGREALDLLDRHEFDGVLMDCQMPVMDGFEATRKIREQEKFKECLLLR